MDVGTGLARLEETALDAIVDELRAMFDVGRCTLRRDVAGEVFPVVVEATAPGVGSLVGDDRVDLRGQPVVAVMASGGPQVVQPDSRAAFPGDAAFARMLELYGGMRAQIVTPVRVGGELRAILSLHELRHARAWTEAETGLAREAAALIGAIVGPAR